MSKIDCLNHAIAITKEAARAGNQTRPNLIILLEESYKKLIELEEDSKKAE